MYIAQRFASPRIEEMNFERHTHLLYVLHYIQISTNKAMIERIEMELRDLTSCRRVCTREKEGLWSSSKGVERIRYENSRVPFPYTQYQKIRPPLFPLPYFSHSLPGSLSFFSRITLADNILCMNIFSEASRGFSFPKNCVPFSFHFS